MAQRAVKIVPALYVSILERLGSLHFSDRVGYGSDVKFMKEDYWLGDTAVVERIIRRSGQWEIYLVFAHHVTPLRLLQRRITCSPTESRARLMAQLMRRLAAKDQRGTLQVSLDLFSLSSS